MYEAQLRHQLTMAQMASYAGSTATHPAAAAAAAPSFHALHVKTDAAAANAHALLQAQLVAAMQNPATVGALYQRLLMEQMMGMGRVGGARGGADDARVERRVRSLRDGDDAGVVRRVRGHRSSRGGAGDDHPHARGWNFDGVVRDRRRR